MHQECEPSIPYDELVVRSNLFAVIGDLERSTMNGWIVKDGEKGVAFGIAVASPFLFSASLRASLSLWYVLPEYRKGRAAFEIFHHFENWSKLTGCVRIEVGASKYAVGSASEINKMFVRRGFTHIGEVFCREV